MKVRTFSSHNGVRFILTFDVPGFVLFFFLLFGYAWRSFILPCCQGVRQSLNKSQLRNISSGSFSI